MSPDLDQALSALAAAARQGPVLVALDFDGALAPLQDDPEASRALPEAVTALRRLAGAPVQLALVSGRGVADLAAKAEVPVGTLLVGSHGAERGRWTDDGLERLPLELTEDAAALLAELTEDLTAAVEGTSARVERKPASVVLHTRTATDHDTERLTTLALALGERGADTMQGKDVVELAVLSVTKGQALADLRRELGAGPLLYAGDDVTDERAFVTLAPQDVTIRVGDGETAARFRVAQPEDLAAVLARLADLLEG